MIFNLIIYLISHIYIYIYMYINLNDRVYFLFNGQVFISKNLLNYTILHKYGINYYYLIIVYNKGIQGLVPG